MPVAVADAARDGTEFRKRRDLRLVVQPQVETKRILRNSKQDDALKDSN